MTAGDSVLGRPLRRLTRPRLSAPPAGSPPLMVSEKSSKTFLGAGVATGATTPGAGTPVEPPEVVVVDPLLGFVSVEGVVVVVPVSAFLARTFGLKGSFAEPSTLRPRSRAASSPVVTIGWVASAE